MSLPVANYLLILKQPKHLNQTLLHMSAETVASLEAGVPSATEINA